MPTTSERNRERIATLMSDPRYWNKAHPEHSRVFAESQRAFRDAYPEPPQEGHTAPGTVHVRAYTRTQDGKEIDVSAYDRRQEIALHVPKMEGLSIPQYLQDIAEGPIHKGMKEDIVRRMRANGDIAETEVTIVSINGVPSVIDILGMRSNGWFYGIDVKTYAYKNLGPNQLIVYPLMDVGGHVFSTSPKIRSFGFEPGQPLPPICVYVVLAKDREHFFYGPLSTNPNCPL